MVTLLLLTFLLNSAENKSSIPNSINLTTNISQQFVAPEIDQGDHRSNLAILKDYKEVELQTVRPELLHPTLASKHLGRFLTVDPMREYHNSYSYVGNRPIMSVDPDGNTERDARDLLLADAVYKSPDEMNLPDHLQLLNAADFGVSPEEQNHYNSGFDSALFYDSKRDEYIYAFRGTTNILDWISNGINGLGITDQQYKLAIRNTHTIKQALLEKGIDKFSVTGHSLGGGLASIAALTNDLTATTFNAAGAHIHTALLNYKGEGSRWQLDDQTSDIRAFYIPGEILNAVQTPFFQTNSKVRGTTLMRAAMGKHIEITQNRVRNPLKSIDLHLTSELLKRIDFIRNYPE
jgi:hypothetical protein